MNAGGKLLAGRPRSVMSTPRPDHLYQSATYREM